ncbi:MAG TPA: type II toxin-antitoxin system VapC family toxin [Candidatus Norongarragalinales archaeon]|nr:type II toxin-antitoxin system VapC family toxin [Candidatus Norongarragalinales archaeon]
MNVVIDSSGWIEYARNGPRAESFTKWISKANDSNYLTPASILFEVDRKLRKENMERPADDIVAFIIQNTMIIPLDSWLALEASEVSREENLAFADSIVRAVAKRYNAVIVTADRDFKGLDNVELIEK